MKEMKNALDELPTVNQLRAASASVLVEIDKLEEWGQRREKVRALALAACDRVIEAALASLAGAEGDKAGKVLARVLSTVARKLR